jgi:hypothetical protein
MTSTISTPSASTEHWRQRAACRNEDPDLFFPVTDDGPGYERQVAAAKAVCRGCPVRDRCLDEALTHPRRDRGRDDCRRAEVSAARASCRPVR